MIAAGKCNEVLALPDLIPNGAAGRWRQPQELSLSHIIIIFAWPWGPDIILSQAAEFPAQLTHHEGLKRSKLCWAATMPEISKDICSNVLHWGPRHSKAKLYI